MPGIEVFNEHYSDYDQWFSENSEAYKNEIEAVRDFIPLNSKGIEIGVGTGRFAEPLGVKTGVEPSINMAALAKNRGINVIKAVAESVPFKDNIFDFALFVTAICFFDNVDKAMNEAFRIIKPNGTIIAAIIDASSPIGKQYQVNKNESTFYKDATFYSTETITDFLTKAGFENFDYNQALFNEKSSDGVFKKGYGEGSFVVIKATKPERL